MIVTVQFGAHEKNIMVEKQSYINISDKFSIAPDTQVLTVNPPFNPPTLDEIYNELTRHIGHSLFKYDAFTNNCQVFITNIMKLLGKNTQQVQKFVLQNKIQEHMAQGKIHPAIHTFTNAVTNAHGTIKASLLGGSNEMDFEL